MTDDDDDGEREGRVRDALDALASAPGEPDVDGAWARVGAAIGADDRRTRRRRIGMGLAGLATTAAAAVAVVALVVDDGSNEAVEIAPAESTTTLVPSTSTTTTIAATTTTEPPRPTAFGELPAVPLVVTTADGRGILLVDGESGEIVQEVARLEEHWAVIDLELAPDGTIYFAQIFDEAPRDPSSGPPPIVVDPIVRAVQPDGTVVDISVERPSRAPAVSPDGRLLAYAVRNAHYDPSDPGATILVVDRVTGEEARRYRWDADDPNHLHTHGGVGNIDFSPDGRSLLFTVDYEGSELMTLDLDAASLSEGAESVRGSLASASWAPDGRIWVTTSCCYPDGTEASDLLLIDPDSGGETTIERLADDSNNGFEVSAAPSGTWLELSDGAIRNLESGHVLELDRGTTPREHPYFTFDAG